MLKVPDHIEMLFLVSRAQAFDAGVIPGEFICFGENWTSASGWTREFLIFERRLVEDALEDHILGNNDYA